MYIGRAQRKKTHSLYQRCRSYVSDTRPVISNLLKLWGNKLYLAYLPLQNDDVIKKVERELIKAIIPPCNSDIYDYDTLPAIPAF